MAWRLCIALVILGLIGITFGTVLKLHSTNTELTLALESANSNLTAMQEQAARMNEITMEMEQRDTERQKQLREFERYLRQIGSENAAIRDALSISIPDELVRGLRAFEGSSPSVRNGAGKSADTGGASTSR